jgi:hypothetical protein
MNLLQLLKNETDTVTITLDIQFRKFSNFFNG